MASTSWFDIQDTQDLITPALLVYPERIVHNIKLMLAIAGDPNRLRPHIKTYKIAEIIRLQIDFGITKFKCATIGEAELLAQCQAKDILLAYQPVANNIKRFAQLVQKYPNLRFSTLVDNLKIAKDLSGIAGKFNIKIDVFLDINNGMNRTGIVPDDRAFNLFQKISQDSNLIARGLHIYDGHIHDHDLDKRQTRCNEDFKAVETLIHQLNNSNYKVKTIIAGGTPTFPIHAQRKDVELSPGTPLLWDAGYANSYIDLPFLPAAVLATRIISNPTDTITCLDLGHKSVAPEMPFPRIEFLNNKEFKQCGHSEEHLVVMHDANVSPTPGQLYYALPMHICPTVIKYEYASVVDNHKIIDRWKIHARHHS